MCPLSVKSLSVVGEHSEGMYRGLKINRGSLKSLRVDR